MQSPVRSSIGNRSCWRLQWAESRNGLAPLQISSRRFCGLWFQRGHCHPCFRYVDGQRRPARCCAASPAILLLSVGYDAVESSSTTACPQPHFGALQSAAWQGVSCSSAATYRSKRTAHRLFELCVATTAYTAAGQQRRPRADWTDLSGRNAQSQRASTGRQHAGIERAVHEAAVAVVG